MVPEEFEPFKFACILCHLNFVDCGTAPAPSNGTVVLTALGVTTYTATATQSCDDGFILVGDPTLQCQASGSWTDSALCFEIGSYNICHNNDCLKTTCCKGFLSRSQAT